MDDPVMRVESLLNHRGMTRIVYLPLIRVRNSSRVFCCVRKQPNMQEVVVMAPGFCTPRIVIHKCLERGTGRKIKRGQRSKNIRGLHYDSNTTRFDSLLHSDGNLFCETFLHLQATTESFSYAGEFGNAKNKLIGDVCNRNLMRHVVESIKSYEVEIAATHFACEGNQVMLAKTRNVDFSYEYHLIVVFSKYSIVYDVCQIGIMRMNIIRFGSKDNQYRQGAPHNLLSST